MNIFKITIRIKHHKNQYPNVNYVWIKIIIINLINLHTLEKARFLKYNNGFFPLTECQVQVQFQYHYVYLQVYLFHNNDMDTS